MNASWRTKHLGDVAEIIAGQSPDGSFYNTSGEGLPFYQGKKEFGERFIGPPANWTTSVTKTAVAGDILMSVRAPVGPINFATEKSCIGRGLAAIRTLNGLDKNFLFYFLLSIQDEIRGSEGAVFPSISKEQIQQIRIAFPDASEQKRIVAILDKAFAAIATAKANTEKNLQNARALFENYLDTTISRRSDKWEETTIGDEADILPGFAFKSKSYTNSEMGVRLLRGDNVVQGSIRWEDVKKWPASDSRRYANYQLRCGDVVLAMDRPWVSAGLKRAQISEHDLPCLLVQRVSRLRVRERLHNRFLFYLISSRTFSQYLLRQQTGIGVPHISGRQISDFRFFMPDPDEQHQVANDLDHAHQNTRRIGNNFQRKLAAMGEMKKSLLHEAFAGKL